MDSFSKLEMRMERFKDSEMDHDVNVKSQWFILTSWAKELLKLQENIHETSINEAHKVERMEKAINEIHPLL